MADGKTLALVGGVLAVLATATGVGQFLKLYPDTGLNPAAVRVFNLRLRAWWLMCSILAAALLVGPTATVVLFGLISFWALREFITLTPTRHGDHRALFWVFFVFTPLQYVVIAMMGAALPTEQPSSWLGWLRHGVIESFRSGGGREPYNVLIPVYAFLFILARVALSGDYKRFLERTAKIQAGLLICVYCLSFAPALLYLDLSPPQEAVAPPAVAGATGSDRDVAASEVRSAGHLETSRDDLGTNFRLLFFLILMVQTSEALQYFWNRLLGRTVIAPTISPSKTWEGFAGAIASTMLVGAALWWATPFAPWGAAGMSLLVGVMGFAGSMTMSAIKRDRGVKDYGTLVEGHGGVLDRIDAICFAAPVFFHVTRFWLS